MKRHQLYFIAILGAISVTASAGVVQNDNYICAYTNNKTQVIISLDTSNYTYKITQGQPFGGVVNISTDSSAYRGCIDILSGNKKSTNVVNWVKKQMAADDINWAKRNMAANITYQDNMPEELNVAIRGNLTLTFRDPLTYISKTYNCPNIILAQGSTKKVTPIILPVPVITLPTNNLWLMSNIHNDKYRDNKTIFDCYDNSNNSLQKMKMLRNQGDADYILTIGLFGGDSTSGNTDDGNLNNIAANDAADN